MIDNLTSERARYEAEEYRHYCVNCGKYLSDYDLKEGRYTIQDEPLCIGCADKLEAAAESTYDQVREEDGDGKRD